MTESTSDKIAFLVAGWALGLLSTILLDEYRRYREGREVRRALRTELWELRYRMAAVVYTVEAKLGMIDKATLNWLRPIVDNYSGVNVSDNLLKLIDGLMPLTDQQLAQLAAQSQASPDAALVLKKYSLPLLEAKLGQLSGLHPDLQARLLQVRAVLAMFNEDVDQARFYFRMTFDNNVTETNYERAKTNLVGCQKNAAEKARVLANDIGKIVWHGA